MPLPNAHLSAPPKILLLTDADVWAGTERHMLDLALALRGCGQSVAIAAPQISVLQEKCAQNGLEFVAIEKNGLFDRAAIRELQRLLKSQNFGVIHAHNGRTQLSAALACALTRRGKAVFTQHFISPSHSQMSGPKAGLYALVHAVIGQRTHRIVAISEAVKAAYLERSPRFENKTIVVPNGIDDPQKTPLEDATIVRKRHAVAPDAPFVACAARLEIEKEIHVLIAAFERVLEGWPAAQLRIAGTGELRDELENLIRQKNLEKNVRLVGFLDDVFSFFAAADAVALPAPAEPFGLVFLEAMALEKPLVACSGGAAPEIIVEGQTGFLVPPSDSAAMVRAIEKLLQNPANARQMGLAGRARFLKFYTREHMARATLEVYRSVASRLPEAALPEAALPEAALPETAPLENEARREIEIKAEASA